MKSLMMQQSELVTLTMDSDGRMRIIPHGVIDDSNLWPFREAVMDAISVVCDKPVHIRKVCFDLSAVLLCTSCLVHSIEYLTERIFAPLQIEVVIVDVPRQVARVLDALAIQYTERQAALR